MAVTESGDGGWNRTVAPTPHEDNLGAYRIQTGQTEGGGGGTGGGTKTPPGSDSTATSTSTSGATVFNKTEGGGGGTGGAGGAGGAGGNGYGGNAEQTQSTTNRFYSNNQSFADAIGLQACHVYDKVGFSISVLGNGVGFDPAHAKIDPHCLEVQEIQGLINATNTGADTAAHAGLEAFKLIYEAKEHGVLTNDQFSRGSAYLLAKFGQGSLQAALQDMSSVAEATRNRLGTSAVAALPDIAMPDFPAPAAPPAVNVIVQEFHAARPPKPPKPKAAECNDNCNAIRIPQPKPGQTVHIDVTGSPK